jgi:polysaccharide pyruvyl transferase WcaK-like protein
MRGGRVRARRIFFASPGQLEAERTNLGDRAIFGEMVRCLKALAPDLEITVLSSDPEYTERLYDVRAVSPGTTAGVLASLRHIWRSDVVVVGGGELVQDRSSLLYTPYNLFRPALAKLLNKRVVAYAIGIGDESEMTFVARLCAPLVLDRFDLVMLRDPKSLDVLRRLGVRRPVLALTADAAITIEPAGEDRVREILAAIGTPIADSPGGFVCLSMRSVYHRNFNLLPFSYRKRWGLVSRSYERRVDEFKTHLARLADHAVEQFGCAVLFLPAYVGAQYSALDDRFTMEIRERMRHADRSRVLDPTLMPTEIAGVLARAELLVAVPLHALILGGSVGTPLVDINYASKARAYMRMVGQERYVIPAESLDRPLDPDALFRAVDEVWRRRAQIRAELAAHNLELRRAALRNAELFVDHVCGTGSAAPPPVVPASGPS